KCDRGSTLNEALSHRHLKRGRSSVVGHVGPSKPGCASSRTRLLLATKLPRADARAPLTPCANSGPRGTWQSMRATKECSKLDVHVDVIKEKHMDVRTDEIGDRIYRISTFLPQAAEGAGFTFNEFLIYADEPVLFHCGHRKMFPIISAAVSKIISI